MIVTLLAELLSGLQAPRSPGKGFLGTGTESLDKLRIELHLFGWMTPEEIEPKLREALEKELIPDPTKKFFSERSGRRSCWK
jgi:hypothetical protein